MDKLLKPCPFCGESVFLAVRPIHNYVNEEVGADITCERCLATFRSEEATNVDEVVEHWNKRALCTACKASSKVFDKIIEAVDAWNKRSKKGA